MKKNMLQTFVNGAKRNVTKMKMKGIKYSPEISVVLGVVGVVSGTVMACMATRKLDDVIEDHKKRVNVCTHSEDILDEDRPKEIMKEKVVTVVKIAKLYAPSATVMVFSISSIMFSHVVMKKRNMELAAAYTGIYNTFKDYRGRVAERFGEDVEKEIRYGIKKEEITETTTTKSGKEKTTTKTLYSVDPNTISEYAVIYTSGCIGWSKDPEYNKTFLKKKQEYANQKLKEQGYLYLNEVYEMLGFAPTKAGHVVGWIYDEKNPVGDNYVDFGIYDMNNPATARFVNGLENSVLLDFNVDGNIYEMM